MLGERASESLEMEEVYIHLLDSRHCLQKSLTWQRTIPRLRILFGLESPLPVHECTVMIYVDL